MSESQLAPNERTKAQSDFLREANILMGLSHPGLCRVFGTFVEDKGKHFLVMEYIEGHTLEDELIGQGRPLDWQPVATWGIMLAEVLIYLHSQTPPVIYRDLKPANVMLLPNRTIKLIDFGIARQLFPARLRDTARLGTDGYAPLEQYSGHSEARSDLYALGASLYHLLTGRVPDPAPIRYGGQPLTPIQALNPSVPDALDRVIQQALQLEARKRFPDARAMRHAIEWACRSASMPAMSVPSESGRPSYPSRPIANGITSGPSSAPSMPFPTSGPALGRATYGPVLPGGQVEMTNIPPRPSAGMGGEMGAATGVGAFPGAPHTMPKLRLWPLRLDAGLVQPNTVPSVSVELSNRGGGQLVGVVETNTPCVSVDPPRVDATTNQLVVHINTAGLPPGEYRALVAVRTNGGDQIIPVQFMVGPTVGPSANQWSGPRL
jgi:serine/threonine protein kinase